MGLLRLIEASCHTKLVRKRQALQRVKGLLDLMLEAVFGIKSSDESLISSQTLPQSGLLSDERQVSLPELLDMESRGDYSRLAALIGAHQETALFRKFASLNAQNILYLQAELVHLESELGNITQENKYSGDSEKASFLASLFNLKESSGTTKDLQWRKFLEVREKLKEYSMFHPSSIRILFTNGDRLTMPDSALLQYSQIQKFEKPRDGDLRLLQEWLNRPEGGDFFLQGREADIWEAPEDIIALSSRQAEKDSLTRWISESLVPWYHRRWGHRVKVAAPTAAAESWG